MIAITLNILILAGASFTLYQWVSPKLKPLYFCGALTLKLLAGLSVGLLYFYYYGHGDTLVFHEKAMLLANTSKTDFWMFLDLLVNTPLPEYAQQPRTWFMIKIVAVLHIFTNNNYWISALWLSLFSFTGFYYLWSRIARVWPFCTGAAAIAFLFFPSVIFWSSGIIKESITLGAMTLAIGLFIDVYYRKKSQLKWLIILLLLIITWQLKYYVVAVFVVVGIPFILMEIFERQKRVIAIGFLIVLGAISFMHPNFYPERFVNVVFQNYQAYIELSDADGALRYWYEQNNIFFLIVNAPLALFNCMFMPLWPVDLSMPVIAAVIENIALMVLTIGFILKIFSNDHDQNIPLQWMLLIYSVILAIFLGLSVPNFGTLSRFRVSFLPFFIWVVLSNNTYLAKFINNISQKIWIRNR